MDESVYELNERYSKDDDAEIPSILVSESMGICVDVFGVDDEIEEGREEEIEEEREVEEEKERDGEEEEEREEEREEDKREEGGEEEERECCIDRGDGGL